MRDLVSNAWHDLRENRLWPLALILALALVAVPVVLLKGAPKQAPPPVAATGKGPTVPLVAGDQTGIAGSSKLGSFNSKDPFRSLAERPRTPGSGEVGVTPDASAGAEAGLGSDLGPDSETGSTAAGGGPASGESGSGGGGSASPSGGGGSGSGSSREPSSGSGGSGSGGTPSPADPKFYEYAAEVDFGRIGNERRYRDVRALDSLPSERNPVVVYLGQTRENESAFLVNQAIGQRGEGNCVPNKIDCSIVYLRPRRDQDDHYFGPPPREYHLKLIAVRRKLDGRDPSARSSATSSESRTPTSGKRSKQTARRTRFDFRIPMIAGRRR